MFSFPRISKRDGPACENCSNIARVCARARAQVFVCARVRVRRCACAVLCCARRTYLVAGHHEQRQVRRAARHDLQHLRPFPTDRLNQLPYSDYLYPYSDYLYPYSDYLYPYSDYEYPYSDYEYPYSDLQHLRPFPTDRPVCKG